MSFLTAEEVARRGIANTRLRQERSKVKKEEDMKDRKAQLDSVKAVSRQAEFHRSTQAGSAQTQRLLQRAEQTELRLARCALTQVRRAALQELLSREQQQFTQELHTLGKAFYLQRI
ncbi:cilia- and flagella-associated protein 141 [Amia ocellicauda]|uniref:cilia- and flagella-associated protein 141 n=1 Tax=Amia ocellicauda TaxID=2972642 RepID=UPI00346410DF